MDDSPFFYLVHVDDVFAFPRGDIEPGRFGRRGAISCFVKVFGDEREVHDSAVVDRVRSNSSDPSFQFDSVDEFHKIFSHLKVDYSSPHLMRAL